MLHILEPIYQGQALSPQSLASPGLSARAQVPSPGLQAGTQCPVPPQSRPAGRDSVPSPSARTGRSAQSQAALSVAWATDRKRSKSPLSRC